MEQYIYVECAEYFVNCWKFTGKMKILVTGAAGFIGSQLVVELLKQGYIVVGIDNHNDYYDRDLKEARLKRHFKHPNYRHYRADISDKIKLQDIFSSHQPQRVVNLAAQAGVRYSLKNPHSYIDSNITGFLNLLECCRENEVEHLVYASSSSVYGLNEKMPYSAEDNVDHPLSLYAASKKSNELMAHAYSHLFHLPTTGLRFFTVYGPWGRPDMALFKFTKQILSGELIELYNFGNHKRDFTYIDDVVYGLLQVIEKVAAPDPNWNSQVPNPSSSFAPWRIYNIGSHKPVTLGYFLNLLEQSLGVKATIKKMPLQPGDVPSTFADIDNFAKTFDYKPSWSLDDGIKSFVNWYREFYLK